MTFPDAITMPELPPRAQGRQFPGEPGRFNSRLNIHNGQWTEQNCKQRNRPAGGALFPAIAVGFARSVDGF